MTDRGTEEACQMYVFYLDVTDGEYGHLDGPNYVVAGSLEEAKAHARSWAASFYSDVEWSVHLIRECNDVVAPRADWGEHVVFRLIREDLVEDIEARLTAADESYDHYVEEREAEGWDGYDTEEAQEVDGYQLGYVAGLRDALRRLHDLRFVGMASDRKGVPEPCHTSLEPGVRCLFCGMEGQAREEGEEEEEVSR